MKKANRQKGVIAKTAANAIAVVIVTVVGTVIAMMAVSAIAVVIVTAIIKNRQPKSLIIVEWRRLRQPDIRWSAVLMRPPSSTSARRSMFQPVVMRIDNNKAAV